MTCDTAGVAEPSKALAIDSVARAFLIGGCNIFLYLRIFSLIYYEFVRIFADRQFRMEERTTQENLMARHRSAGPTDREMAILSVLWERGPSTVREVHEALNADSDTGYTTTLKLMQIMADKGLLSRKDAGRQHIYRPAVSQEKTQSQVVGEVLEKVFAGSAEKLVMRALSARKVSPEELKRIREMLDEMEGT